MLLTANVIADYATDTKNEVHRLIYCVVFKRR